MHLTLLFPDTSVFFKVEFLSDPIHESRKTKVDDSDDSESPRLVIIWISLETLLPIAKKKMDDDEDEMYEVYAILPEVNIVPPISSMVSKSSSDVRNVS